MGFEKQRTRMPLCQDRLMSLRSLIQYHFKYILIVFRVETLIS